MNTTGGNLALVALTTIEKLEFQFVPSNISIDRRANFPEIAIVGRNTPKYHYTGGKKSINLELDFYSEEEDRQDVIRKVRWLEALAHSDGSFNKPQKVLLIWGDLFRDEEWIVSSVQPRLESFNQEKGFLPQQAYVRITLLQDEEKNIRWSDVLN